MAVLLICVVLSGCTEQKGNGGFFSGTTTYSIGDTVTVGNIKYTFLSANWEESWGSYYYKWEVKGENMVNIQTSGTLRVTKYVMENGYIYEPSYFMDTTSTTFTINPGKDTTKTISCYDSTIDRDFLPIDKIYFSIDGQQMILNV